MALLCCGGINREGIWEQLKSRRELLQSRSIKAPAWKRKVISSKTNRLCNNARKWIHLSCFVWLENVCSLELFQDNFFSFGKLGFPYCCFYESWCSGPQAHSWHFLVFFGASFSKYCLQTILPMGSRGHVLLYFVSTCQPKSVPTKLIKTRGGSCWPTHCVYLFALRFSQKSLVISHEPQMIHAHSPYTHFTRSLRGRLLSSYLAEPFSSRTHTSSVCWW